MSSALESTNIIKIFFCYAREDEDLRNQVENQLVILKNQGLIVSWYDRKISAGKDWGQEIDIHLNTAQIILLLISPAFMVSKYCWGVEMKRALERQSAGEARVIPIILQPVLWEDAPFSKLQVLPTDGKAVTTWANTNQAYEDIARGIRKTVKELLASYKIEEGDDLFAGKRYQEALIAYDQAINFDHSANAYTSKGNALAALKRYSEALTAYDEAIRLNPHFESARNGKDRVLGQFETQLREARQLEAQLREVLQPLVSEVQVEEEVVPQIQNPLSSPSSSSKKTFPILSSQKGNESVNQPRKERKLKKDVHIGVTLSRMKRGSLIFRKDEEPKVVTRSRKNRTLLISVLLSVVCLSLTGLLSYYAKTTSDQTHATATANAYTYAYATATANAYNINTAKGIMFGFDPQHTHFNFYERVLNHKNVSSLVSYWTAPTGGNIDSSPIVANDVVYIGSDDHHLYAFNAAGCGSTSCSPIWTASTGGSINSSPAVANGIVYIGSDDHNLYAYRLSVKTP